MPATAISLEGHQNDPRAIAFSPDGTQLVTAGFDGTVRLWDAASGAQHAILEPGSDVAFAASFSPDGRLLAAASPAGRWPLYLLPTDEFVEMARQRITRDLTGEPIVLESDQFFEHVMWALPDQRVSRSATTTSTWRRRTIW